MKKTENGAADRIPEAIAHALRDTIRRLRRIALLRGIAAVAACFITALLVIMAIDAAVPLFSQTLRWFLTIILFGLSGYAVYRWLWRPLCREISLYQIARRVETHHPELEERLSSTIDLLGSDDGSASQGSRAMIKRLTREAIDGVRVVIPEREYDFRRVRRYFIAAGVVSVVLAAVVLLWPRQATRLIGRAVAPYAAIGNAAAVGLQVLPGNVTCARGDSLEISVVSKRAGIRSAGLRRLLPNGREVADKMTRVETEEGVAFTFSLPFLEASFRYRIFAGGGLTEYFQVSVIETPEVVGASLAYDHPAYTGRKPETIEMPVKTPGQIGAVAGTRVTLGVVLNKAVRSASLLLNDKPVSEGEAVVVDGSPGHSWSFTIATNQQGTWMVELGDEYGFTNKAFRGSFASTPDVVPTVELVSPAANRVVLHPTDRLPLSYRADDDHGIAGAALVVKADAAEAITVPLAVPVFDRESALWHGRAMVDLPGLELSRSRTVTVQVKVDDRCPSEYGGPGEGLSRAVTIQLDGRARSYVDTLVGGWEADIVGRLTRSRDELKRAAAVAAPLPPVVGKDEPIPDGTINQIRAAYEHTWQAHVQMTDTAELIQESPYQPLAETAFAVVERHIEPARRELELLRLTDTPADRARMARNAGVDMAAGILAIENLIEQVKAHSSVLRETMELAKVADRGRSLAEQGAELDPDADPGADWRARQRQLAEQAAKLAQRRPGVYADFLAGEEGTLVELIRRTKELADVQSLLLGASGELGKLAPELQSTNALEQLTDQARKNMSGRVAEGRRALKIADRTGGLSLSLMAGTQFKLSETVGKLAQDVEQFEGTTKYLLFPRPAQDRMRRAVSYTSQSAMRGQEAAHRLHSESAPLPSDRPENHPIGPQGPFAATVANQKIAHTNLVMAATEMRLYLSFMDIQRSLARVRDARERASFAGKTAEQAAQFAAQVRDQTEENRAQAEAAARQAEESHQAAKNRMKETDEAARLAEEAARQNKWQEAKKRASEAEQSAEKAEDAAKEAMEAAREATEELAKENKDEDEDKGPKPPLHFAASRGGGSGTGSGDQGTGAAIAGSAPGAKLKEKPPPPMPRAMSEAMDRAVTAESLPRAKDAADAAEGFAQMLDQMAGQMAADSGMSEGAMSDMMGGQMDSPQDQMGESSESSENSESSEGAAGGPPSGGTGSQGGGLSGNLGYRAVKDVLSDLGVTSEDWLRLPSELRNDILEAGEGRAPAEYRDLIQQYFRDIARPEGE